MGKALHMIATCVGTITLAITMRCINSEYLLIEVKDHTLYQVTDNSILGGGQDLSRGKYFSFIVYPY